MPGRGAKATRFIFSDAQQKVLNSYLPAFEKVVHRINPGLEKYNNELSTWKTETALSILASDLFKDIATPEEPLPAWKKAIVRTFTNYFNNNMKAKEKQGASGSSSAAAVQRVSSNSALRTFVLFAGDFHPRQLFAQEHEEEIQAEMEAMQSEYPNLRGGGLKKKALAKLWEVADHKHWESKTEELAKDTYSNQKEFPFLIADALQNICAKGYLGSSVMSLSYGFRNAKDGVVAGTIYAGQNLVTGKEILNELKDQDKWRDTWKAHADILLPRKPAAVVNNIPMNEDGIPVFPNVNLTTASAVQLVQVLQDYFTVIWESSFSSGAAAPSIPWKEIQENPSHFYDIKTFTLPVLLKNPKEYLSEPASVYQLIQFLNTSAKSFPFRFVNGSPTPLVEDAIPPILHDIPKSDALMTSSQPPSAPEPAHIGLIPHATAYSADATSQSDIPPIAKTHAPLTTKAAHTQPVSHHASNTTPKSNPPPAPEPAHVEPISQISPHTSDSMCQSIVSNARMTSTTTMSSDITPAAKHSNTTSESTQPISQVSRCSDTMPESIAGDSTPTLTVTAGNDGVPAAKPSKRGRAKLQNTKAASKSRNIAQPSRQSTRQPKRKVDEVFGSTASETALKKKRKPGWVMCDPQGNYYDEQNRPCDKDGNLLENAK
ncbi:hypothetical protein BDZ97DRAFT_1757208 [Flammula alnicola]|nr:hypothetical protein BDZ97DRAFT_1757208 [Flammula alnicola]